MFLSTISPFAWFLWVESSGFRLLGIKGSAFRLGWLQRYRGFDAIATTDVEFTCLFSGLTAGSSGSGGCLIKTHIDA